MDARPAGILDPAAIAGLSGLELMQAIRDGRLPAAPIGSPLSYALVEAEPGFVAFEGVAHEGLLNPLGTVHGGWALTLIDSAAGAAAHTTLAAGTRYTTVETKANFVRPILPDGRKVRAEGRVVAQGRQIITAEARVLSEDGKLLAHGGSTLIVLAPAAR